MGQVSVIYGAILGSRWSIDDPWRLQKLNSTVLEQLPTTDDWPFLTRSMFALPCMPTEIGHYRQQVIHFGASFKGIEWEWERWLLKFETLLTQVFWDEVLLHLHTEAIGHYNYHYQSIFSPDFYKQAHPIPNQKWQLLGGPRYFDENAECLKQDGKTWHYLNGEWKMLETAD